jgi:cell division cycle 20-like protein 1 (cofactor of APC complex)
VQVWDIAVNEHINEMQGHSARMGALALNGVVVSPGSHDRLILCDTRMPSPVVERRLVGYQQEVCGLKWSPDNQDPASGAKDSRLLLWNLRSLPSVQIYTGHLAAVKVI